MVSTETTAPATTAARKRKPTVPRKRTTTPPRKGGKISKPSCVHTGAHDERTAQFKVLLSCGQPIKGEYTDCSKCCSNDPKRDVLEMITNDLAGMAYHKGCTLLPETFQMSPLGGGGGGLLEEELCACKECVSERLERGHVSLFLWNVPAGNRGLCRQLQHAV